MKTKRFLAVVVVLSLLTVGVFGSGAQNDSTKGVIVEQVVPESKFQVKVWTDKLHYSVGETMTISVRSEKGGYLTLYDIQPNGKVNQIYPNYFQNQQRIKGGKVYQIPAPGSGVKYRIAPPEGKEILWAIVSSEPGVFPLQEATKGNPYPEVSQEPEKFAKSVKGIVVEQKKGWGAGYTIFYIGPPLGGNLEVTSEPTNAFIHLDGVYQGQTPMKIYDLTPGKHKILIRKSGYQDWISEVTVQPGEISQVHAQLTKLVPGWMSQTPMKHTKGGVTTVQPFQFRPPSKLRNLGWYWLDSPSFSKWAGWKFDIFAPLPAAKEAWLNFNLAVTNSLSNEYGGQGYGARIQVTLKVLNPNQRLLVQRKYRVQLENPFRPTSPQYSEGEGYQTYGSLRIPASLVSNFPLGGILLVEIARDPGYVYKNGGYQPVIGANMNGVLLRYKT